MRWLVASLLLILSCSICQAQDVGRLYTASELDRAANVYGPNLRLVWEEDFFSRLTPVERSQAGQVRLELPLVGAHRHPLDFYSDVPTHRVFLPIASVKFVDDLAVANAYYVRRDCFAGPISDYAAILRFRPTVLSGSPLQTLGVPASALDDRFVDDVAQKTLKSTIFFVMAHEYAHVMYHHAGYSLVTAAQAQRQEEEADAFALQVMRRIGVPPLALVQFFTLVSRLEPSPVEFRTTAEYEAYVRQEATHPVSGLRILAVAQAIEDGKADFARLQTEPKVWEAKLQTAVEQLRIIGRDMDDSKLRRFLAETAETIDVVGLAAGCTK
jgi:hypothetical protein